MNMIRGNIYVKEEEKVHVNFKPENGQLIKLEGLQRPWIIYDVLKNTSLTVYVHLLEQYTTSNFV